jgi:hypothetical protein
MLQNQQIFPGSIRISAIGGIVLVLKDITHQPVPKWLAIV